MHLDIALERIRQRTGLSGIKLGAPRIPYRETLTLPVRNGDLGLGCGEGCARASAAPTGGGRCASLPGPTCAPLPFQFPLGHEKARLRGPTGSPKGN